MYKLFNDRANTEMIPAVVFLFITTAVLYTCAFVFPPSFEIVYALCDILDTGGSLYYDVESTFNLGVTMWYFMLVLMIVVQVVHIGLLAIKRQRYTGEYQNENDF